MTRGMAVAEDERPVAADVIDVGVAVRVPLAAATGAVDGDHVGRQVAGVVGDAARKEGVGARGEAGGGLSFLLIGGNDPGVPESVLGHGLAVRPVNGRRPS